MSFWSKLAKIGGFAVAPFTGGVSIPIGQAVGSGIEAFSKGAANVSQAQAANRGTKAEQMADAQEKLEQQLLAREVEKRAAQADAYKKGVSADMALNWKPFTRPANIPVISYGGGLSEEGKPLARELMAQAKNRLTQKDLTHVTGMPDYRDLTKDPEYLKTMKPGIMERILGYGSAFGPLVGAMLNRQKPSGEQPGPWAGGYKFPRGK